MTSEILKYSEKTHIGYFNRLFWSLIASRAGFIKIKLHNNLFKKKMTVVFVEQVENRPSYERLVWPLLCF